MDMNDIPLMMEKEEMYKKSKKRINQREKKREKSSMKREAKHLRMVAAHGEAGRHGADDQEFNDEEEAAEYIYLRDTPINGCNICGKTFNSENGKTSHVEATPSHWDYTVACPNDRCGGLFLNASDLEQHKGITKHLH